MHQTTATIEPNTVNGTTDAESRPARRRPRRALAAAALVIALFTLAPVSPAAAATNGHACFTYRAGYGIDIGLENVNVRMYYFDFSTWSWQYAGRGFDRRTNGNGCASYNLAQLGNYTNGMQYMPEGWYDWSGHYVTFAVWDVSSYGAAQRTYYGLTNGYVAPGNYAWRLDGTAACWGITCQ